MSEPRKINISGSHTGAGASDAYADPRMDEARARARANAEAARLRRSQQFPRVTSQQVSAAGAQVRRLDLNRTQGSRAAYDIHNDAEFAERQRRKAAQAAQVAQSAARPVQQVSRPAQSAARPVQQVSRPAQPATRPVQQAPTAQASAPRQIHRSSNTTGRTIHRAQPATAAVATASVQPTVPAAEQAVTPHPEVAQASRYGRSSIRMEGSASSSSRSGSGRSGGAGGKPPRGPGRGKNGGGDSASGRGKRGKKKTKGLWWKILLGTVAVIALIIGGAIAVILSAIRPSGGGNLTISQLLNTPEGLDGQQLNILVLGIDRSAQGGDMAAGSTNDSEANDGNTDMILYVQLDFVNDEVRMLQIPRNILVTTDYDVSHNYQINNVAITQGSDGNNNYGALAQLINDQLGLYIDGYVAIRLEALVELVDTLGPIQVYVPQEITYTDQYGNVTSHLDQGLQWMNGATAEFFLRARKTYAQSDIQRLNVQRYFYSAMFARLRAMTVWDVAKILPVVMNYMETDLPVSKLVSAAVSLLSVSSDHIMLCQVPVYMGQLFYQDNDIDVIYRQGTADLLNTYFRTAETQVSADQLNLCDNVVDVGNRAPTDPNVQYMGTLNQDVVNAANESGVETDPNATYDLPEPTPTPGTGTTDGTDSADSSSDSTDSSESDDAA